MNAQRLMSEVQAVIESGFPDSPVYMDRLPEDVQRPCFALELQKEEFGELNFSMVRKTATVLITGFVALDSGREELSRRQDRLMELFAGPAMRVDDRYLSASANKGKGAPDFFQVQVAFSWSDVRPGYHDPDDMTDPVSAAVPKMEDFACGINPSVPDASGRTNR